MFENMAMVMCINTLLSLFLRQISVLNKRVKIFLNYFLGPVLFIWVSFSIYREIQHQKEFQPSEVLKHAFQTHNLQKIIGVMLLMILNWGIEARKWQVLVRSIEKISILKAFKAVFTGQSLAVNTPNRIGEYVGRVMYLDEGHRLKGVALTIVGSLSQTIITLLVGVIGMFMMKSDIKESISHILSKIGVMETLPKTTIIAYDIIFYGVLFMVVVLLIIYFELSWLTKLLDRLPFVHRYSYLIEKLEDLHWGELTRILSLSTTRYVVFVVQFILLLQVFEVEIPFWESAGLISVFFLVLAVVPTISSIELSLRGLAAVELFGILSNNEIGMIYTVGGLWFINLIIPALIGSLFIFGLKLFKR
jgi:hypothetical protein